MVGACVTETSFGAELRCQNGREWYVEHMAVAYLILVGHHKDFARLCVRMLLCTVWRQARIRACPVRLVVSRQHIE